MQPLFAILLSLLILAQPLSKMLVVMEYQVNKNYIAAVLCINKARPQMHCEGKCQLSKGLKSAEKHDKKLPAPVKEILETVYFYQPVFEPVLAPFSIKTDQKYAVFNSGFTTSPVFSIFHPPCFQV